MEERHAAVMRELVNRYLKHRQKQEDGQGVTEDDLNEIKGDISAFRYELLDILRDNGMKVSSNDQFRSGEICYLVFLQEDRFSSIEDVIQTAIKFPFSLQLKGIE